MLYETLCEALTTRADRGLLLQLDNFDRSSSGSDNAVEVSQQQNQLVDFRSNDALSSARNPQLIARYKAAISKLPVSPLGSTGSRTTSGNTPFHVALERRLAAYYGSESALLFSSGFVANLALRGTLPQTGDAVVCDAAIHASIHEGLARTRAKNIKMFEHNEVESLRRELEGLVAGQGGYVDGVHNVFVAVESVYSVDGDMAPLTEIVDLLKAMFPKGNAFLIVDEVSIAFSGCLISS